MKIITLLLLLGLSLSLQAQVYVQLEIYNDPKALKYTIGDEITYQVDYNPGIWSKGTIEQILVDENTLVLNNEILQLKHATDFMLFRKSVKYIGGTLQSFGIIWLVQGSIVAGLGLNTTWKTVLTIGGGSYLTGWLLRKLFYRVPIKLNDKNRLRIIDTRFVVPSKT